MPAFLPLSSKIVIEALLFVDFKAWFASQDNNLAFFLLHFWIIHSHCAYPALTKDNSGDSLIAGELMKDLVPHTN